jgi:uncharacterized protein (TIGR02996 family)
MTPKTPRQVLEEALVRDFEDLAAHSAYADLLMEEGDPRGEYIRLVLAQEDSSRPANELIELRRRASELYQRHERDWLGGLAGPLLDRHRSTPEPMTRNIEFTFRRGWLASLEIHIVRSAFLAVLAHARETRLLQELTLADTRHRDAHTPLDALLGSPYLGAVRRFTLGDPEAFGCTADGTRAVELVRKMLRLEGLTLLAENVDTPALFATPLPQLGFLHVAYADPYALATLGGNQSLGRLTHLFLDEVEDSRLYWDDEPGEMESTEERPAVSPAEVRALVASPHLTGLTHLRLRLRGLGDAGCEEIVRSGILPRLRRLDLRGCGITDAGAELLAGCPDVARLEHLDVGANAIGAAGIDRLRELDLRVQYDSQFGGYGGLDPDDESIPF